MPELEETVKSGPHGEGPVGVTVPDTGAQGTTLTGAGPDAEQAPPAHSDTEPPMAFPDPGTQSETGEVGEPAPAPA